MVRVLVIEDEPEIAEFVGRGLELQGFEVAIALTAAEGRSLAASRDPDLIILDLMLPDADGLDVCRQLRSRSPVGIVILTARHLMGERVRGLDAGADDYIPKPFALPELLARVRAVLRRRGISTEKLMTSGGLVIDQAKRVVYRHGKRIDLTPREFDLLAFLASRAGQVVTREQILDRIWSTVWSSGGDPVKVYVRYLRKKLNTGEEDDVIETVRGSGYMLRA